MGQKVSQIQAVLARRCASIGDLQQHLLRAGWQRGVAQWGVLGEGGEWAAVAGFDGTMSEDLRFHRISSIELNDVAPPQDSKIDDLPHKPSSNVSNLPQRSRHSSLYYTNVFVKNSHDGRIFIDDPALAEWSIDAMAIVRRQLYRAANGTVLISFIENWAQGDDGIGTTYLLESQGASNYCDDSTPRKFPLWASLTSNKSSDEDAVEADPEQQGSQRMTISDLHLMASEVSALLNVMEDIVTIQRARRLNKLKPPHILRRNWYVSALGIPALAYFCFKMEAHGYGWDFVTYAAQKLLVFFREHVSDPLSAM